MSGVSKRRGEFFSFTRRDSEGEEGADVLIFCSDEERDGDLGGVAGGLVTELERGERGLWAVKGEKQAFRLALLGGLLNALVSEGWKPQAPLTGLKVGVVGVDKDGGLVLGFSCRSAPLRAFTLVFAFFRVSTSCIWL